MAKDKELTYGEEKILKALDKLTERLNANGKKYLTPMEAAELLGLSRNKIYRMIGSRKIPFYKNGSGTRTYFKREELEEWMTATRVQTDEEIMQEALKRTVQA